MVFRAFSVGPEKGLVEGACEDVPRLMVICGPNGVGKSTLLYQLKRLAPQQAEQGTQIIYMGPHRAWRRSSLHTSYLFENRQHTFLNLLGLDTLPGFSGLPYVSAFPRSPDSTDESHSLVKFVIVRLEQKRKDKISQLYDEGGGQISEGALGDVWGPMRSLTKKLLPHLTFHDVDSSNPDNVRCLFLRVDGDQSETIDIDDLSSGERAIISMFLPFLEYQMLNQLEQQNPPDVVPTALLDEPDLHLHPGLQGLFLDYLRRLAAEGQAQFIITTHSPTLVDSATADELFLLAPVNAVGGGNQLARVASNAERLHALSEIMGATHLVTRCRPIVFVEGQPSSPAVKATDQLLIQILIPESEGWVVVPSGGRTETIRNAERLRTALPEGLPGIPAYCLVDADRASDTDPDWAISWPVANIENLLLDPQVIYEFLSPYAEQTGLADAKAVEDALQQIAESQDADEVRARVHERAPSLRLDFRDVDPSRDPQEALDALATRFNNWRQRAETLEAMRNAMATSVSDVRAVIDEGRRLEAFRGKQILHIFFDKYGKHAGFAYPSFTIELARRAVESERVRNLAGEAALKLQLYVPRDLIGLAEELLERELPNEEARDLAQQLRGDLEDARREFDNAERIGVDRNKLRSDLIRLGRLLQPEDGMAELLQRLNGLAVEIAV